MKKFLLALVVIFTVTALAGIMFLMESTLQLPKNISIGLTPGEKVVETETVKKPDGSRPAVGFVKFASEQEFKDYLSKVAQNSRTDYSLGLTRNDVMPAVMEQSVGNAVASLDSAKTPSTERYSSTNVQVMGIDEPDIVKNDGKNIYLSQEYYQIYARPLIQSMEVGSSLRYPYYQSETKVIGAVPADKLKILKNLPVSGNLLIAEDVLMVFQGSNIAAYSTVNPDENKALWKINLLDDNTLVGARLYDGKLYLVTRQNIRGFDHPCPYLPYQTGELKITIPCTDIYHPMSPVPTDVLYTVGSFDVKTGQSLSKTSFTGSNNLSVTYMSTEAIYVTNYNPIDVVKFTYDFLSANEGLAPKELVAKIGKLISYDISYSSKQSELYQIIYNWQNSADKDENLRIKNELTNKIKQFTADHLREYENTGIAKINLKDFKVVASGSVPGRVLNQFSLDEHNGNLRIATTIGNNWISLGFTSVSNIESVSDVYALDSNLKLQSSVKDLGKGEQIYSVRFIGDRGYVVTFRQTDPFYVLDLKDPKNVRLSGELKIPGYSSYLEELDKDLILGVGKDGSQVKIALFDVSDPNNPKEADKYLLDEYWSEALTDHQAFLRDDRYGIFFLPGSNGGYVFSYDNKKLALKKAISEAGIKRALYINDVMYMVGQNKLSSWNEKDWSKLGELDLTTKQ